MEGSVLPISYAQTNHLSTAKKTAPAPYYIKWTTGHVIGNDAPFDSFPPTGTEPRAFSAKGMGRAGEGDKSDSKIVPKRREHHDSGQQATTPTSMQQQVEIGQAPKEVKRVDKPHVNGQKPHVHFNNGTSINQDGTVHDKHKGTPQINNKVKEWLKKNGWKGNE